MSAAVQMVHVKMNDGIISYYQLFHANWALFQTFMPSEILQMLCGILITP